MVDGQPSGSILQLLEEYYRCPRQDIDVRISGHLPDGEGFFLFGPDTICYGRTSSGHQSAIAQGDLHDASADARIEPGTCLLSFNPGQVVHNLRAERYVAQSAQKDRSLVRQTVRAGYYALRPLLPVFIRRHFQRLYLKGWKDIEFPSWPVDTTVDRIYERLLALVMNAAGVSSIPFIWFWPDGHPACLILTHDVETAAGRDYCSKLMDIDDSFGFKSSFQIVPEQRYEVPHSFLDEISNRSFEINLHGLNHDGHLFTNYEEFSKRAKRINEYARTYHARGFRSPVLYRNQDWFEELEFSYDMSVPNVGHLDPQRGGCCTVMPYYIKSMVELPLTTTQDYSLFNIMNEYNTALWQTQVDMIIQHYGLVCFNTHPDYIEHEPAASAYMSLLGVLADRANTHSLWRALPGDVDIWWRQRSAMQLVPDGKYWRIEGEEAQRARVAIAHLTGDGVTYELHDVERDVVGESHAN